MFNLQSNTYEMSDIRFEEIFRVRWRVNCWNEENQYRWRNNIEDIREKTALSKNIDTLTKEESLAAYCRSVPGTTEAARHLRRLVLTGLQFYQAPGNNIYVLDGTLSHISHKSFFFLGTWVNEINSARVSDVCVDYRVEWKTS